MKKLGIEIEVEDTFEPGDCYHCPLSYDAVYEEGGASAFDVCCVFSPVSKCPFLKEEKQITICVTGHRPGKMYGYNLSDARYIALKKKFKELLMKEQCGEAISGMALGVDTVFALAVLELKEEGYPIRLHCAIPCRNQSKKWFPASVNLYNQILAKADIVRLVSDEEYKPYLMQKRNEYMVDLSDKVIAVWDGSTGGTGNCVAYAKKKEKEILRIMP